MDDDYSSLAIGELAINFNGYKHNFIGEKLRGPSRIEKLNN